MKTNFWGGKQAFCDPVMAARSGARLNIVESRAQSDHLSYFSKTSNKLPCHLSLLLSHCMFDKQFKLKYSRLFCLNISPVADSADDIPRAGEDARS